MTNNGVHKNHRQYLASWAPSGKERMGYGCPATGKQKSLKCFKPGGNAGVIFSQKAENAGWAGNPPVSQGQTRSPPVLYLPGLRSFYAVP
jgi:hypothetical protein